MCNTVLLDKTFIFDLHYLAVVFDAQTVSQKFSANPARARRKEGVWGRNSAAPERNFS